jgi:hypothetical protein
MGEVPPPIKTSRLRWRNRAVITLSLLVVSGVAIGQVVRGLAGPAAGTTTTKQVSSTTKPKAASRYRLDGDFLSLTYPDSFTVVPNQTIDASMLQKNLLHRSSGGSLSLTVVVTSLPSGRLDDDSSYLMRSLRPETYQIAPQTVQGERVVVATRQDSFEEVAFWSHAGKLATIALSGSTTDLAATRNLYQQVLQSVEWQ